MLELASELYPDYPDPMPVFQYLGGEQGKSLLQSALQQPGQGFAGRWLYPTTVDKAARLLVSMIKDHPFVDGNKRAALTGTFVFLLLNGWLLAVPRNEAVNQCLAIARTRGNVNWEEVARWMRPRTITMTRFSRMSDEEKRAWVLSCAGSNLDTASSMLFNMESQIQMFLDIQARP